MRPACWRLRLAIANLSEACFGETPKPTRQRRGLSSPALARPSSDAAASSRMRMKPFVPIVFLAASAFAQSPAPSVAKHPFTFEDMMKLKRVQEPVPSPDGKWVVFAAEDVDLEANTKTAHLWIVPASGGESK